MERHLNPSEGIQTHGHKNRCTDRITNRPITEGIITEELLNRQKYG